MKQLGPGHVPKQLGPGEQKPFFGPSIISQLWKDIMLEDIMRKTWKEHVQRDCEMRAEMKGWR